MIVVVTVVIVKGSLDVFAQVRIFESCLFEYGHVATKMIHDFHSIHLKE